MTSFVHLEYSREHPGVARLEASLEAAQRLRKGFSGTRGLATLLLSAMVAAVMVVADQLMTSLTEGHLLVMWGPQFYAQRHRFQPARAGSRRRACVARCHGRRGAL